MRVFPEVMTKDRCRDLFPSFPVMAKYHDETEIGLPVVYEPEHMLPSIQAVTVWFNENTRWISDWDAHRETDRWDWLGWNMKSQKWLGDCEDHGLTKLDVFVKLGWNPSTLRPLVYFRPTKKYGRPLHDRHITHAGLGIYFWHEKQQAHRFLVLDSLEERALTMSTLVRHRGCANFDALGLDGQYRNIGLRAV